MANREASVNSRAALRAASRRHARQRRPPGWRWSRPARDIFSRWRSGEIFPFSSPQPVPCTQDWFLGVANLRGGLFGVVDLASFVAGRAPAAQFGCHPRRVAPGGAQRGARGPTARCSLTACPACAAWRPSPPPRRHPKAHPHISAAATPTPQVSTGRRSTCRRCHQQPQFLSIGA